MFEKQNDIDNIRLLKSMRFYYSKAKKIKTTILYISIIIPVLFMTYRYLKNVENTTLKIDLILISLSLIWILISYFLDKWANQLIVYGSKIQEKFDINVLDIKENDVLILNDINEEVIYDGEKSFKEDISNLYHWYGNNYLNAPHYLKVLIAQRMNIMWGNELKQKFKYLIYILFGLLIIIPTTIASIKELSFNDTLLFLILPMIPLYYIVLRSIIIIRKQISNNETINKKILKDCNNINDETPKRCRQYQDYIFQENRVNSILIPDWFFKIVRDKMNNKLIETNNTILKKYTK